MRSYNRPNVVSMAISEGSPATPLQLLMRFSFESWESDLHAHEAYTGDSLNLLAALAKLSHPKIANQ